jgi:catechol 2,3-dioxygenase-like lactoylglutathione lyase family enzyme
VGEDPRLVAGGRRTGTPPLIGHLGLNVPDLAAAKDYYDQLMPLVGFEPFLVAGDEFAYRPVRGKPGTHLFFYPATEARPADDYSRQAAGLQHLAFMVPTRSAVHDVHRAVAGLGSTVLEEPRAFPQYPPPYYATFWLDPHGFMLEAVCHHDRR